VYRRQTFQNPRHGLGAGFDPDPIINGRNKPVVHFISYPLGYWNSADVASLTDQIHNRPVILALLKVIPC
jgi:hypothetical protein